MNNCMDQEFYNSMMRLPGEANRLSPTSLPLCPKCREKYCGDGNQLCTECAVNSKNNNHQPTEDNHERD